MYNRYYGNSGRVERVGGPEPPGRPPRPGGHPGPHAGPHPGHPGPPPRPEERPPGPPDGLSGLLGRILRRVSPGQLETEDLLLVAVLYLLYRECGDREFLLAIAAYLFC